METATESILRFGQDDTVAPQRGQACCFQARWSAPDDQEPARVGGWLEL